MGWAATLTCTDADRIYAVQLTNIYRLHLGPCGKVKVKWYISHSVVTRHSLQWNRNDKMMSHLGSEPWHRRLLNHAWFNVTMVQWITNTALITVLKSINHSANQSQNTNKSISKSTIQSQDINQSTIEYKSNNKSINQPINHRRVL